MPALLKGHHKEGAQGRGAEGASEERAGEGEKGNRKGAAHRDPALSAGGEKRYPTPRTV